MPSSTRSIRILLTASEAYPALERAFLSATTEIWASFLVFNLSTRLRSPEGLHVGRNWFGLLVHTLNRGVAVHMTIADVDPVARAAMHRAATRQLRMFCAAAEVANGGARLQIVRARHPAQTGALMRLAAWPYNMKKVFRTAGWLNRLSPERRKAALRDMNGAVQNLRIRADGTVSPRLWSLPRLFPALHHQKLAVIDRKLLYIGGLDLDEQRSDPPTHGRADEQTRHDVQLMIEGSVVAEAQQHLESFHDVIDGKMDPPRTRRLLRTLSRARPSSLLHYGPVPLINELQTAHLVLSRRAGTFIYMETQYFRDQNLASALAETARAKPGLQMILILPAAPDDVAFEGKRGLDARFGEAMQARALRRLRKGFGPRLFVGSPSQRRPAIPDGAAKSETHRDLLHGAPLIYVHAKVSVFDDASAVVSSANMNGRSLLWDTEAGVYLTNRNEVTELRHRVMAHWLPKDAAPDACEPATAVRAWGRVAWTNAAKHPSDREGFLLPYEFASAEAFGRFLPILPPEFV